MRILQLTETLHAGGAETFVVRLSNALVEAGHEVTVAVAVPIVNPAVRSALDPRITVEVLPVPRWRWWSKAESAFRRAGLRVRPFHWRQRRWLDRLVKQFRPDVINSHLLNADLLAHESRIHAPNARHVVTIHGDYPMFLAGTADPRLLDHEVRMQIVGQGADAIVGVAADHLALFRERLGADPEKLHLIYNGYRLPPDAGRGRDALGLPDGKFLFGMVARGIAGKGWDAAISAFERLGRANPALILVGEGPYLDDLRGRVTNPNVHFTGFAPDPTQLIRQFDVGLLPSRAEALPTAVIEYLACGKPVIATNVGEVSAMLDAGDGKKAGLLLDPDPDGLVDALAEAMRTMIEDDAARQAMAARTAAAFEKFAMERCVERYEAIFRPSSSSNNPRH